MAVTAKNRAECLLNANTFLLPREPRTKYVLQVFGMSTRLQSNILRGNSDHVKLSDRNGWGQKEGQTHVTITDCLIIIMQGWRDYIFTLI